jgi:hypothetical protein
MSSFSAVVASETEQAFVDAAVAFSNRYGKPSSVLSTGDGPMRAQFVQKIADYICKSIDRHADKTVGKLIYYL